MNDWFYISGFILLMYCAFSLNPIKYKILKNVRNYAFFSLICLLVFTFSIGGGDNQNDLNSWIEKYYYLYGNLFLSSGVYEWIFWTAWISIPISYFSIRLAIVRDVEVALAMGNKVDFKAMRNIHWGMMASAIVGVSFFITALESIAELITYLSLSYEKIRLLNYYKKPDVYITHVLAGIACVIIFKVFFNKAVIINSKYV